jgi:hypothetical protein
MELVLLLSSPLPESQECGVRWLKRARKDRNLAEKNPRISRVPDSSCSRSSNFASIDHTHFQFCEPTPLDTRRVKIRWQVRAMRAESIAVRTSAGCRNRGGITDPSLQSGPKTSISTPKLRAYHAPTNQASPLDTWRAEIRRQVRAARAAAMVSGTWHGSRNGPLPIPIITSIAGDLRARV